MTPQKLFSNRKVKQAIKDFLPSVESHSNFIAFDEKGEEVVSRRHGACYAALTYIDSGKPIDRIFLFFGEDAIEKSYKPEMWCDWIINRSFWADVFITKDAEEGMKNGFEVNTAAERILVDGGMGILRQQFEFGSWEWSKLVEMGYDEYEAFALSTSVKEYNGRIYPHTENSNHKPISPCQPFDRYLGAKYVPAPEQGTYKEGVNGHSVTKSFKHWGCDTKVEIGIGAYNSNVKWGKRGLNKVLKQMKEAV